MRLLDHLETPRTLEEIIYACSGFKNVFDHIDVLEDHVKNMRRICISNGFWSKYRRWYFGEGKICEGGQVKDGTPLGIQAKIDNAKEAGRTERAAVLTQKRNEFEEYMDCFMQVKYATNLLDPDCDEDVEELCDKLKEIQEAKANNKQQIAYNRRQNQENAAMDMLGGNMNDMDINEGVKSLDGLKSDRDELQRQIKMKKLNKAKDWARLRLQNHVDVSQEEYKDMKSRDYWSDARNVNALSNVWKIAKHERMKQLDNENNDQKRVPILFYRVYRLERAVDAIKLQYKDAIQQKTNEILQKLTTLVRLGKVRVAMRYNDGKNQDALFLFCKRRIMKPIHRIMCSSNRGDLYVRDGKQYIVNQRRKRKKKFTLDVKSVNAAFFEGNTKRIIHHFSMHADLRAFIPYYAVQIKRDEFKPKNTWGSTLQKYEESGYVQDNLILDGDMQVIVDEQQNWKRKHRDLMGEYGDMYYAYFTY